MCNESRRVVLFQDGLGRRMVFQVCNSWACVAGKMLHVTISCAGWIVVDEGLRRFGRTQSGERRKRPPPGQSWVHWEKAVWKSLRNGPGTGGAPKDSQSLPNGVGGTKKTQGEAQKTLRNGLGGTQSPKKLRNGLGEALKTLQKLL